MGKKFKLYAVLASIVVVGIAGLLYYFMTKGAPAIKVADYIQATVEPVPATEVKYIPDSTNAVPDMKLAAQTDALALYYHEETSGIAVLDKRSGKVWRSNPEDLNEDPVASPYEKEILASQVVLNYRDNIGTLDTFSSFADSIAFQQYTTEAIENGLRITYVLGDGSAGIDVLPKFISKERMEEKVLSQLTPQDQVSINRAYLPSKTNPDIMERLDTVVERPIALQRVKDAFDKAGYTEEDLAFDNEENGGGGAGAEKANFTVVLEYRLDGDSLVVTVPTGQIEETEGFRVRNFELLNFFGAAGPDEEGYMVVPDGSGGLIHLNNGKANAEIYAQRVYGDDLNDNSGRRGQISEYARLPVFGLKTGDHAMFAEITKGEAIANITASVSGRQNSYNNIHASFLIRGEDELELYKGTRVEEIQLLTDERFKGDVEIRYSFLSGADATYSGMAKRYRERLEAEGKLKPLEAEGDLPFYVDVLGAVDKRKSFLGVPYKGIVPMTTVEQAGEIAEALKQNGIGNVQMRYLGWFNGGMNHSLPTDVDIIGKLGNKKKLQSLAAQLEADGGMLFPDVAFQHVLKKSFAFKSASDAARHVTREQAWRTPYNRAFNSMDRDLGIYYLLSPAKLPHVVDEFMDSYDGFKLDALALRDLGSLVHADYRVSRPIFRDTAKNIVTEQLGKLSEQYSNLLITGGNAYALPYAQHAVNVPMEGSNYNIVDEVIPFYQMVVHGYIDYAGSPINLHDEQDVRLHLLRAAEYGAAPHFLWSYESSSNLKFTAYDTMFSTEYTNWLNDAADMYAKLNEAIGGLRSQKIDDHIKHREGVVETRYENGTSVYVNYTDKPVTVGGVTIDALNFTVGGDGK